MVRDTFWIMYTVDASDIIFKFWRLISQNVFLTIIIYPKFKYVITSISGDNIFKFWRLMIQNISLTITNSVPQKLYHRIYISLHLFGYVSNRNRDAGLISLPYYLMTSNILCLHDILSLFKEVQHDFGRFLAYVFLIEKMIGKHFSTYWI